MERHRDELLGKARGKCPICGVQVISLIAHLRKVHKEELLNLLEEIEEEKSFRGDVCPLCNLPYITMGSHIRRGHGLCWDDFVKSTGFEGKKISRSPETIKRLSETKKAYYDSPAGEIYKKIQKEKFSGNKNPACQPEVRDKISRACMGRPCPRKLKELNSRNGIDKVINNNNNNNNLLTYGYFYKLICNNKYYYARSTAEFEVLVSLLKNNISFAQESMKIPYTEENGEKRYYLPDFVIGKTIYETKVDKKELEVPKYKEVKKALESMGYSFRFLNRSTLKSELNIDPLTKRELEDFVKSYVGNHLLHIVAPKRHNGKNRPLLKSFLGDDYKNILKENEEKFNENKKRLCI